MPAQAIIAALSLHKFTGGKMDKNFFSSANLVKFSLISKFEATPPAITKVFLVLFLFFNVLIITREK